MVQAPLGEVVDAAKEGRSDAWDELVFRFQDLAVATTFGWSGDVESARDAAQEAFLLAFQHLDQLDDPEAFPGWLARLVRTASARQRRRVVAGIASLEAVGDIAGSSPDPAILTAERGERERVRVGIEALPSGERIVIALHYIAGLSYPQAACFLGISVSAAKKRAFSARAKLKEILPMATDMLVGSRPSGDGSFRDAVLFFAAIRSHDAPTVRRLLARRPDLIDAEEDWSPAEAFDAKLPFAGHGTPLVRAAGAADLEIARLLLDAGASANERCWCAAGESPLWTATVVGSADVAALLLERGADPNAAAFNGATPLHVAAQRGRQDLIALLRDAGADPERTDCGGRRPADWAPDGRLDASIARTAIPASEDHVYTGIRALDLFAPLSRCSVARWPAAYGLGQLVTLLEIARAIPAETWFIGFDQDQVDRHELEHGMSELQSAGRVMLLPRSLEPDQARVRFDQVVEMVTSPAGRPRFVVCFESRGQGHVVEAALPVLAASRDVLATIVVEPYQGTYPAPVLSIPEGYDAQVAFDPVRSARRLYPALDPRSTMSRRYPTARHRRLAERCRELLRGYQECDPDLGLDPAPEGDRAYVAAVQALIRFLVQNYRVAEPFTSLPGESTPPEVLLRSVEELVGRC